MWTCKRASKHGRTVPMRLALLRLVVPPACVLARVVGAFLLLASGCGGGLRGAASACSEGDCAGLEERCATDSSSAGSAACITAAKYAKERNDLAGAERSLQRACENGELAGCVALTRLTTNDNKNAEIACRAGHVASCSRLGVLMLLDGGSAQVASQVLAESCAVGAQPWFGTDAYAHDDLPGGHGAFANWDYDPAQACSQLVLKMDPMTGTDDQARAMREKVREAEAAVRAEGAEGTRSLEDERTEQERAGIVTQTAAELCSQLSKKAIQFETYEELDECQRSIALWACERGGADCGLAAVYDEAESRRRKTLWKESSSARRKLQKADVADEEQRALDAAARMRELLGGLP